MLFPNINASVNYLETRLEHQQTVFMTPTTENQLTSIAGCLSTPGASRNTQALFHSIVIAGSVLDGCSLTALPDKSVPAVEQSLSASPQHPTIPQTHGEPLAEISQFSAAALSQTLGKVSNTVPSRCLPLCHVPTSQPSPWEQLLGWSSLGI